MTGRPRESEPAAGDPDPATPAEEIVALPIEDFLDLHPFAPRDIPSVVAEYLREARARGFREVRLIHGKGIGFQRERVRQLLATLAEVESYRDAPAERGHWGATIVLLKPASD